MARKHIYENLAQQRILKTLLILFGHEVDGLSPSQIAKSIDSAPSVVTRDIYNMIEVGVVERLAHNDNLRITPRVGQKALAILTNIERATTRLEDTRNRYTREN